MIYPWHQPIWQQLVSHWQRLPHAYLLIGREHTGKTAFARHLAQALLCEHPGSLHEPCGQCPSCHLFAQDAHPDFYLLTPEQPETGETTARKLQQIKIDAVRAILEPLQQTSVRGGRRVVCISPAESMNVQAANALLKMLEEPPEAVVFILVSHNADRVLPTIRSRCRALLLPAPDADTALQFWRQAHPESADQAAPLLAFHSHAPLFEPQPEQDQWREQLLQLLSEPRLLAILDYAAQWDKQKLPLAVLLDWLYKWLLDMLLVSQQQAPLYYPHHQSSLHTVAQKTQPHTLFRLIDHVHRLSPYGHHSLNVRMQTESLLGEYLLALNPKTR